MLKLNYLQIKGFLRTPALWTSKQFEIEQFDFPKIDLGDLRIEPIPKNIRLGHQMEYVFEQLIVHSNRYKILAHNVPIKDSDRTIGEIDFILQDSETEAIIHVELTYKFYLIDHEIVDPIHSLVGPNRRDSFFAKTEKIRNKQFPLLHSKHGVQVLEGIGLSHEEIVHKTCFKAQLFSPYRSITHKIEPLNDGCICGYWLSIQDFKAVCFKSLEFYVPSKSEWVIEPYNDVKWMSHSEILASINDWMLKKRAPMVWLRKSNIEFEKFFVVL